MYLKFTEISLSFSFAIHILYTYIDTYFLVYGSHYFIYESHCILSRSQRHQSPGWASASFKIFLFPSWFMATTVQFLHTSFPAPSFTPSPQCSKIHSFSSAFCAMSWPVVVLFTLYSLLNHISRDLKMTQRKGRNMSA